MTAWIAAAGLVAVAAIAPGPNDVLAIGLLLASAVLLLVHAWTAGAR